MGKQEYFQSWVNIFLFTLMLWGNRVQNDCRYWVFGFTHDSVKLSFFSAKPRFWLFFIGVRAGPGPWGEKQDRFTVVKKWCKAGRTAAGNLTSQGSSSFVFFWFADTKPSTVHPYLHYARVKWKSKIWKRVWRLGERGGRSMSGSPVLWSRVRCLFS